MNFGVAGALLLLLGLLTLVSYVNRVYQEVGKFLSREFQDNIDVFEQKIEPKLGVARARAALSMAGANLRSRRHLLANSSGGGQTPAANPAR